MIEYKIANLNEKEEIIDFINYVFSYSHNPHDFKLLQPKCYADDSKGLGAIHYLAKKDSKIKALVANREIELSVIKNNIKIGLIGNVSVHPYSRGEGFMKELMSKAVDDAKSRGTDIMVLSGKRQRYGYFGFENCCSGLCFTVTDDNIRHCLPDISINDITFKPIDELNDSEIDFAYSVYEKRPCYTIRNRSEYINIMKNWRAGFFMIYNSGNPIGYSFGGTSEVVLCDEKLFPAVLKAVFMKFSIKTTEISVAPFESERTAFLYDIAEGCSVSEPKMINVLNWENVLRVYMDYKSEFCKLNDGSKEISIDDNMFKITVKNGKPEIEKVHVISENAVKMTHKKAIHTIFGMETVLKNEFYNWFPLPFTIDGPDTF